MPDKYTAVWVSHSSISDFLHCPRSYFLKNVYHDPKTNHKIQLANPSLSLGQAVHAVLEEISFLSTKERFKESLLSRFHEAWEKVSGRAGGFTNPSIEKSYRERGEKMLSRLMADPGPLANLAVKIKMDLPWFWLSESDNLILCGKLDWLEYLPETESIHIIDFKTGRSEEEADSLQLPIYQLLATNCQTRPVAKASYWYLDRESSLVPQNLPSPEEGQAKLLTLAKKVKLVRQLERFVCPEGKKGCRYCRPYEKIITGQAEFVGLNSFGQDIYLLDESLSDNKKESEVL